MERISSRQNPIVRQFRELGRGGDHGWRVLLDGDHLLEEALASRIPIEIVAVEDRLASGALASRCEAAGVRVIAVSAPVLAAISPVREPSGIVAIARCAAAPMERVFTGSLPLVVIAAEVQDPGNVGAIVRAAEACGATGIVCGPGSADPFGWKALRGSMGSAFRVPIAVRQPVAAAMTAARAAGLRTAAAIPTGGTPLPACDLRRPIAIVFGGEGSGLPEALVRAADDRITIPMRAPVESINVATAAAIVLYEAARQRSTIS